MDKLKPELFSVMRHYNGQQFLKDAMAGIIVAIIALPLSIAFAIGSGVSAEKGIYSAIISSIIIAFLGGSRVQITGPTGAFIVIMQSIIVSYGLDGLILSTIMAGIILIVMGLLKFGKLIKFIPSPITIGFTGGIAVSIFTLSIKDFFGLTIDKLPKNFFLKWGTYIENFNHINMESLMLGLLCVVILIVWPKINQTIPNSLIAIIVGTSVAYGGNLNVAALGDIPKTLTLAKVNNISIDHMFSLLPSAFTIAVLVAMQALLSAVVTDELINSKHRASMELIAQGVANIVLGIFGCIPATGGVARSISNAKNGGRTPIAAIFHGITLFIFLFFGMPLLKMIPLCVLAGILIVVSVQMFHVKAFLAYKKAPKSDLIVLIASCVLTFAFDLVFAIEVGMVLACVLFMKRMSEVTTVSGWKYIVEDDLDEENDVESLSLKVVPKNTLVFEVSGPMFFGAADKLMQLSSEVTKDTNVVIVRMRSVPAIDVTALNCLKDVYFNLRKQNVTMIFSHVLKQPHEIMEKAGFIDLVGKDNFCPNIDAALQYAETFLTTEEFMEVVIE